MSVLISFIIIGRNEGRYIGKCFKSIYETIEYNNITSYEIIYVDSNSSDNSIEVAKNFNGVKIYKLTNVYNAAIARNVGADRSNGDILFFIDGDMEIIPEFLTKVLKNGKLVYPFISGNVIDHRYDEEGKYLYSVNHNLYISKEDKYSILSGGIFLIERDLWLKVRGMDNNFRRSQDFDFSIKMSKYGFMQKKLKEDIAFHHTIDYRDSNRMWKMLFDGDYAYLYGPIFRRYFFFLKFWKIMVKKSWSALFLFISIIYAFIYNDILFLFIYLILITIDIFRVSIKQKSNLVLGYCLSFLQRIILDVFSWFYFLFFYPSKIDKNSIKVEEY